MAKAALPLSDPNPAVLHGDAGRSSSSRWVEHWRQNKMNSLPAANHLHARPDSPPRSDLVSSTTAIANSVLKQPCQFRLEFPAGSRYVFHDAGGLSKPLESRSRSLCDCTNSSAVSMRQAPYLQFPVPNPISGRRIPVLASSLKSVDKCSLSL